MTDQTKTDEQPERELKDQRIPIMMSASELKAIDDWMFSNRIRSRAEAIRRLCQISLAYNREEKKNSINTLNDIGSTITKVSRALTAYNGDPDLIVECRIELSEMQSKIIELIKLSFKEDILRTSAVQGDLKGFDFLLAGSNMPASEMFEEWRRQEKEAGRR